MKRTSISKLIVKIVSVTIFILSFASIQTYAQIACSNSVQISMDENCQVKVSPEMILEGQHSDYSVYVIAIDGLPDNIIDEPGEYGVTVRDTRNNNSCWSKIKVEDKLGPQMVCDPIHLPCSVVGLPGDPIIERYIAHGQVIKTTQDSLYIGFTFDPQIPYDGVVHEMSMDLYMEHDDISEMQAYFVSPHGKKMMLFDKPMKNDEETDCLKKDMMVYLNDYAPKPYHMMKDKEECKEHAVPSMHGEYQPHDPFSHMKDQPASGIWKLVIADVHRNQYKAFLKHCKLRMTVAHGKIGLPFDHDDMDVQHLGPKHMMISGGDICGQLEAEYSDIYDKACFEDGKYYGLVNRSWSVKDAYGNTSWCTQPIYYDATHFDHFDMPYDYDGFYFPSYTCHTDFHDMFDEYGMPSPEFTGKPTDKRHSGSLTCGNIQVTYKDLKIDICAGSYKVLRTWTLINWCETSPSNITEHTQVIEVKDNVAPVVKCPSEEDRFVKLHNPHSCVTDFVVPAPHIKYECSDYDWTVQFYQSELYDECEEPGDNYYSSKGVTNKNGDVVIEGLGLGCVWIKYIVTDKCGNSSSEACQFKLLDKAPPVPICEEETVVSLGTDGVAKVFAQTFDDLSWDNCSDIASYQVRKINNLCDTIMEPMDYVTFCCEEIGLTVMVELIVSDHYGNKNSCMVEATIQDKVNPYLNCPDSVAVSCLTPISSLTDAIYGAPNGNDNCSSVSISDVVFSDSLNQCGIGYVFKTWMLNSEIEGQSREVCTQVFSFEHHDSLGYHEVYFPNDTLLQGCAVNADVSVTGEPVIHEVACGLIAISSEDTRFSFVDDACEKIIREWTVIDWCRYKPEQGVFSGYWVNSQIIKIQNQDAPVFTGSCEDIVVCSYSQDCLGDITMGISAQDECSSIDQLQWEYAIDLFSDGSIDIRSSELTYRNDSALVHLDSLPLDTMHQIVWTVSDGCQNYARCNYGFTIEDCKPPTPYCISDVVTTVMQQSGEVEIWAQDFNLKSEDNCTDEEDILFSFSGDVTDTNRSFTCADVPNGRSARQNLQVWLTDSHGNQDLCNVTIELQDNSNVCPDEDGLKMDVEGQVSTENGNPIHEVEITIISDQPGFPKTVDTGDDGVFAFSDLDPEMPYEISSSKNIDYLNGVTTLDIVLIQQHIIGETRFNNPYKIIASDIDNNQSVSVSDLIMLRQVVLGAAPNFPNGQQSWRFLNTNGFFLDEESPFPFTENIQVNIPGNTYDFMGIKIGDVNGSVTVNAKNNAELRHNSEITLVADDRKVKAGDQIQLTFALISDLDIRGMQHSLNIDPLAVSVSDIHSSSLSINQSHFRSTSAGIHLSWNQQDPIYLSEGSEFYTIDLNVHRDGNISDFISINTNQKALSAELYDSRLDIHSLDVVFKKIEPDAAFTLYQNRPNPFELTTKIGFELKSDETVALSIFDLSGKRIYDIVDQYSAGYNEVSIDKDRLAESGIYYYTLSVNAKSQTKKMILLE